MVLQPGQAAQRQQQQVLNQQVVHHPQPQQAGNQQQTSTSTPQVGAQNISVGSSPQVSQLKQLHLQQQILHQHQQQQQQQQHVRELHLKLITVPATFMCVALLWLLSRCFRML